MHTLTPQVCTDINLDDLFSRFSALRGATRHPFSVFATANGAAFSDPPSAETPGLLSHNNRLHPKFFLGVEWASRGIDVVAYPEGMHRHQSGHGGPFEGTCVHTPQVCTHVCLDLLLSKSCAGLRKLQTHTAIRGAAGQTIEARTRRARYHLIARSISLPPIGGSESSTRTTL